MGTTEQIAVQEITITPEAAAEIQKIRKENSIPENHGLRMGVKAGGCCGLSYLLAFDENAGTEDKVLKSEGIKVMVDLDSLELMSGTTLHFMETPNGRGFKFENPNDQKEKGSCGCGDGGCCD
jgi:iron-sulfur cluster assembly protein